MLSISLFLSICVYDLHRSPRSSARPSQLHPSLMRFSNAWQWTSHARGSPIRTARAIKKQLYAAPPQSRERRRAARNRALRSFGLPPESRTVIVILVINTYVRTYVYTTYLRSLLTSFLRSFVRSSTVRDHRQRRNRDTLRYDARCVILIRRNYTQVLCNAF